jgi:gas vesicle protein
LTAVAGGHPGPAGDGATLIAVRRRAGFVDGATRSPKEEAPMGFMSGVITGVAVAAGAAAWYMSRSGERFREQYRVDRKLGELGDQIEARTREIQSSVNAQLAEIRVQDDDSSASAAADARLDDARASAAEAAAELAADVEAKAAKVKRAAKDAEPE